LSDVAFAIYVYTRKKWEFRERLTGEDKRTEALSKPFQLFLEKGIDSVGVIEETPNPAGGDPIVKELLVRHRDKRAPPLVPPKAKPVEEVVVHKTTEIKLPEREVHTIAVKPWHIRFGDGVKAAAAAFGLAFYVIGAWIKRLFEAVGAVGLALGCVVAAVLIGIATERSSEPHLTPYLPGPFKPYGSVLLGMAVAVLAWWLLMRYAARAGMAVARMRWLGFVTGAASSARVAATLAGNLAGAGKAGLAKLSNKRRWRAVRLALGVMVLSVALSAAAFAVGFGAANQLAEFSFEGDWWLQWRPLLELAGAAVVGVVAMLLLWRGLSSAWKRARAAAPGAKGSNTTLEEELKLVALVLEGSVVGLAQAQGGRLDAQAAEAARMFAMGAVETESARHGHDEVETGLQMARLLVGIGLGAEAASGFLAALEAKLRDDRMKACYRAGAAAMIAWHRGEPDAVGMLAQSYAA